MYIGLTGCTYPDKTFRGILKSFCFMQASIGLDKEFSYSSQTALFYVRAGRWEVGKRKFI